MKQYITNDKIFYHPEEVTKFIQGQKYSIHPITIELHLSNKCNNKCVYCGMEKIKNKKVMSYNEIIKSIDFIKSINGKAICFSGGGEPTLNPFFYDAIRYAANQDIGVGIITNGIHITDHKSILEYATWIRISLDAADSKTYFRIRKSKSFDIVCSNIKKLLNLNKNYNKTIGLQFVVNEHNFNTLTEDVFTLLDRFPKINYINIRPIEAGIHETIYHHYQLKIILSQISGLKHTEKVIVSNKWDLFRSIKKNFGFNTCHIAPYSSVIDAYGDLYLCCHMIKNKQYTYGNIFEIKEKDEFYKQRELALSLLGKSQGFNAGICPLGCRGTDVNMSLDRMINESHKNFI